MIRAKEEYRPRRRQKRIVVKKRFYVFVLLLLIAITFLFRCIINNSSKEDIEVAFAEKDFVVCIDSGHGGHDVGAQNKYLRVFEKDISLDISLKIGKILEENNVEVIYTRKDDNVTWDSQIQSLQERSRISNKANSDYFVSIHTNYYEKSSSVRGTEVWCRFRDTEDEKLAKTIIDRLSSVGFTENRGIKYEDEKRLYVLRNTDAISVLVELGYLSNNEDTKYLMTEKGRQAIASAIADSVMEYYYLQETENILANRESSN